MYVVYSRAILVKLQILDDSTLHGVVKYIQEKKCTKIITMAGAGISTCKQNFVFYK
jgi:hypothetical protein